jgi:hypothetical protein
VRYALIIVVAAACGAGRATPATLAGTWTLVAADDEQRDGTRVPAYGTSPAGLWIVDRDGRYSLQIFRTDRRRFASGNKRTGTPDEYRDATLGISTHVGHCAIDPDGRTLTFHIDRAAFPNWDGTTQQRQFVLEGDVLSYRVPAPAPGAAVPISVWRRVAR